MHIILNVSKHTIERLDYTDLEIYSSAQELKSRFGTPLYEGYTEDAVRFYIVDSFREGWTVWKNSLVGGIDMIKTTLGEDYER